MGGNAAPFLPAGRGKYRPLPWVSSLGSLWEERGRSRCFLRKMRYFRAGAKGV